MRGRLACVWPALLLAWATVLGVVIAQSPGGYQGIGPGYDFPADRRALLHLRNTGAVSAMRRHAWMVFAGMTRPAADGRPVWETWFTEDEVFDPTYVPQTPRLRPFRRPTQLRIPSGDQPSGAADESALSYILFNAASREFIQSNRLYSQAVLTQMNGAFAAATPIESRQIPVFPPESMATKSIWWVVKKDGVTPIPIWDPIALKAIPPNAVMPSQSWTRVVGIDASRGKIAPNETATLQFANRSWPNSHVVPLSKVYGFRIDSAAVAATVNANKQSNASNAEVGDSVVLMALHYTTKEIPQWMWATVWWHDRPDEGRFAADRPPLVRGVWRNYLMNATYSMDTPVEPDGSPPICFNPWLEAKRTDGVVSNCMGCHQQAVWPSPDQSVYVRVIRGTLWPSNPMNASLYAGSMRLDFLWSIAIQSK
jgi:hypothetical protein